MEIQNKLDEDFLFYLGFIKSGINKFKENKKIYNLCQAWLDRLCGEVANTTDEKRKRNIYLSHLVLCMEEGELTPPFTTLPLTILPKPTEYFPPTLPEIKEPSWMTDVLAGDGDSQKQHDARTYIATKALPDGKGCLAYIALSLDDQEFEYKGEGLDEHMKRKFAEFVPPITDIERILLNRKVPEERQKVLDFYALITQNIAKEIDGRIPQGTNVHTNGLILQLTNNLKQKGEFEKFEEMPEEQRRLELLFLLDSRLQERIMHIKRREDFLDHVEMEEMNPSFFETSLRPEDIHQEHKGSRPTRMWTEAINSGPSHKLTRELSGKYPPFIIKKFLELLASAKEKIAIKVQRRHENVYSQLKKELRKEGEKGLKKYEKTKASHDEIVEIKNAILAAEKKCYESYERRQELLTGHRKERDELYEQVRNAMLETQQRVEEEAAYGKYLSRQINTVTTQAEVIQQVNEEALLKLEDENINIMKNIQKLSKHIQQHENRITNLRQVLAKSAVESGSQFFFV